MKKSRNRDRGKDAEREIAKIFNGKRIGIMGGEDICHDYFSIEVKSRMSFVGLKWMKQAIENSYLNKVPIVVVHKCNTPFRDSQVLINIEDFLYIYNRKKEEIEHGTSNRKAD